MKWARIVLILLLLFINCRDYESEKKIDPYLKVLLQNLYQANRLDQQLLILFRSNEELTSRHHAVLQKKGVKISANIGGLYTAKATPQGIYYLARLRCVISIQPSKQLQRKIKRQMSRE